MLHKKFLPSIFVATAFPPFLGAVVGAGAVVATIGIGVVATLAVSGALTRTVLRGQPSGFILELPPYRRPRLFQSYTDRSTSARYGC